MFFLHCFRGVLNLHNPCDTGPLLPTHFQPAVAIEAEPPLAPTDGKQRKILIVVLRSPSIQSRRVVSRRQQTILLRNSLRLAPAGQ
jgi:hypothetical protein